MRNLVKINLTAVFLIIAAALCPPAYAGDVEVQDGDITANDITASGTIKTNSDEVQISSSGITVGTSSEITIEPDGDITATGGNITITAAGNISGADITASGTIQANDIDIDGVITVDNCFGPEKIRNFSTADWNASGGWYLGTGSAEFTEYGEGYSEGTISPKSPIIGIQAGKTYKVSMYVNEYSIIGDPPEASVNYSLGGKTEYITSGGPYEKTLTTTNANSFQSYAEYEGEAGDSFEVELNNISVKELADSSVIYGNLLVQGDVAANEYYYNSPFYTGDGIAAVKTMTCKPGTAHGDWAEVDHTSFNEGFRVPVYKLMLRDKATGAEFAPDQAARCLNEVQIDAVTKYVHKTTAAEYDSVEQYIAEGCEQFDTTVDKLSLVGGQQTLLRAVQQLIERTESLEAEVRLLKIELCLRDTMYPWCP